MSGIDPDVLDMMLGAIQEFADRHLPPEGLPTHRSSGARAAAVVFAREVRARTEADPRVVDAARRVEASAGREDGPDAARRRLRTLTEAVRSEKLGEVAREFDAVHTISRAREVGSVDRIIPASALRPYLVDAPRAGHVPGHAGLTAPDDARGGTDEMN
jgi:hypothetical protein